MKRGKYELKKRAERQEETRRRIVRATLELHETIGPSLTPDRGRRSQTPRGALGRPWASSTDTSVLGKGCWPTYSAIRTYHTAGTTPTCDR